jgi:hypothetical protein
MCIDGDLVYRTAFTPLVLWIDHMLNHPPNVRAYLWSPFEHGKRQLTDLVIVVAQSRISWATGQQAAKFCCAFSRRQSYNSGTCPRETYAIPHSQLALSVCVSLGRVSSEGFVLHEASRPWE